MLRKTKTWDVRCPEALAKLFPVRKGYYYKVTRDQAREIVKVLSDAYDVTPPKISDRQPKDCNGCYWLRERTIDVHGRGHMKTVFHEFYHHLDHVTGLYDSSDRKQLAWQFADHMFNKFRVMR